MFKFYITTSEVSLMKKVCLESLNYENLHHCMEHLASAVNKHMFNDYILKTGSSVTILGLYLAFKSIKERSLKSFILC